MQSISNYKIFSLNDPFRVIVDVHGRQKKVVRPKRKRIERLAPQPKPSAEKKVPPVTATAEVAPEVAPETAPAAAKGEKQAVAAIVPGNKAAAEEEKKEQPPKISGTENPPLVVLKDQKKRPAGAAENPETGESKLSLALQFDMGVHRIVIDPGHGGKDPGAMACQVPTDCKWT